MTGCLLTGQVYPDRGAQLCLASLRRATRVVRAGCKLVPLAEHRCEDFGAIKKLVGARYAQHQRGGGGNSLPGGARVGDCEGRTRRSIDDGRHCRDSERAPHGALEATSSSYAAAPHSTGAEQPH